MEGSAIEWSPLQIQKILKLVSDRPKHVLELLYNA